LSGGLVIGLAVSLAQDGKQPSSYMPVDIHETFSAIYSRMTAAKPEIMKRHTALLEQRYDLSDRPAQGITMSRSKPLQEGVRVKLPAGVTWDQLAKMSPEQIKERGVFPGGFEPLPHPNHTEGGMVFPKLEIDELKRQGNQCECQLLGPEQATVCAARNIHRLSRE
jgi:cytochrome c peroxidase